MPPPSLRQALVLSPCPGDAQRRRAASSGLCGSGGRGAGSAASFYFFFFCCCCRVIYDMRESHCLDPSCIFPRALPLFPDPRCAAATVRLLWGRGPCRGYAGSAGEGRRPRPGPSGAPRPLPQPAGPAGVPRAWECGFRPIQVHGHRRHSAAGGAGGVSGIWGVWLHSPFPFSAGNVLGAYRSPVPFSS